MRQQHGRAGGAGEPRGGSAASSAIVHSPSAVRIRSRTRHSGSRTLHFAELLALSIVGRTGGDRDGPSIAWMTSATEICTGGAPVRSRRACPGAKQEASSNETLKHLRHQFDRDVVCSAISRALDDPRSPLSARCFMAIRA
jgi:hypothetical protein